MRRYAYVFFPILLVAVTVYIVLTTGTLPERVASHFGSDNFPNGWMPRASYLTLMLLFAVLFPVVLAVVVGFLPRVAAFTINIPNPDYWLAPQRRDATLATLAAQGCWLGSLISVFVAVAHHAILEANAAMPPRLSSELFWLLAVGFVAATVLWAGALYLRFHRVP
jgi:uncharacterized membrane protein